MDNIISKDQNTITIGDKTFSFKECAINEDICNKCGIFIIDIKSCAGIPCCASERKDKKTGYFIPKV